jgi:NAD(P)-dependent dehydrogenase (short-subunit alcohol dehydrogenase family)
MMAADRPHPGRPAAGEARAPEPGEAVVAEIGAAGGGALACAGSVTAPDLPKARERMIPLGRAGMPDEAAGAVSLPCTPESDGISGQIVVRGGGMMI